MPQTKPSSNPVLGGLYGPTIVVARFEAVYKQETLFSGIVENVWGRVSSGDEDPEREGQGTPMAAVKAIMPKARPLISAGL